MTQNELEVIRFIDSEYRIDKIIESMLDTNTTLEIQQKTKELFTVIVKEIALTLKTNTQNSLLLYNEYISMVEKTAMLLVSRKEE